MRNLIPLNSPASLRTLRARVLAPLALLAAALCGARMLPAQAPPTVLPSAPAHKTAHHPHKRSAAATVPQAAVLPPTPPAPELPLWPANEKPTQAAVTWDSQGLRIDAANSSLAQILEDVAAATGAKVEGFSSDQRIFGAFGPGNARDVLSQLLQGSGYNVMMIGDQGQGTPREIVLTSRHAGATSPAANPTPASASDEDADTDEQPQPQGQPPIRPGGPPRSPQQMQQEMQQRQQQMQQQQGQPQPPSNPPN